MEINEGVDTQEIPLTEEEVNPLEAALEEAKDQLLRVSAEYDNFRKRSAKEKEELYSFSVGAAVMGILPVVDNFERAMEAPCADDEFRKGMALILSQMQEALQKMGVDPIPTDIPFDPELHNAVMHTEDEGLGENVITNVMQKGYRLGDRVIRHAMVAVAN